MKQLPLFSPHTLILSALIMIQTISSQTLISSTCRTAAEIDPNINYNFCRTSLQAAPASQCAALQGLGSISIRLIRYNVTDTRCQIKQLLKNRRLDPYVRQCLNDCFGLYSDAISTAKLAMRYYIARRFADLNLQISSIMDAATTCQDGFGEGGVVSPLTKRNNDSFQISAVALSVMSIIQSQDG